MISGGNPQHVSVGNFLSHLRLAQAIVTAGEKVGLDASAHDIQNHIRDLENNISDISSINFINTDGTQINLASADVEYGADVLGLIGGTHGSIYQLSITDTLTVSSAEALATNATIVADGILSNIDQIHIADTAAHVGSALDSLSSELVSKLLEPSTLSITLTDSGTPTIQLAANLNSTQISNELSVLNDINSHFKLAVSVGEASNVIAGLSGNSAFTGLTIDVVLNSWSGTDQITSVTTLLNGWHTNSAIGALLSNGGISIGNGYSNTIDITSASQVTVLDALHNALSVGGYTIPVSVGEITVEAGIALSTADLADLNALSNGHVQVVLESVDGYVSGATVTETDASGATIAGYGTTNGSGQVIVTASDSSQDHIVVSGGTDTFTNQKISGELIAPVGFQVSTPLTTLLALSSHVSADQITSALGLSGVDLANFDPVAAMSLPAAQTAGLNVFTAQQGIFTI